MGAELSAITSSMAIGEYLGGAVNKSLGLELGGTFIILLNF